MNQQNKEVKYFWKQEKPNQKILVEYLYSTRMDISLSTLNKTHLYTLSLDDAKELGEFLTSIVKEAKGENQEYES